MAAASPLKKTFSEFKSKFREMALCHFSQKSSRQAAYQYTKPRGYYATKCQNTCLPTSSASVFITVRTASTSSGFSVTTRSVSRMVRAMNCLEVQGKSRGQWLQAFIMDFGAFFRGQCHIVCCPLVLQKVFVYLMMRSRRNARALAVKTRKIFRTLTTVLCIVAHFPLTALFYLPRLRENLGHGQILSCAFRILHRVHFTTHNFFFIEKGDRVLLHLFHLGIKIILKCRERKRERERE